MARNNHEDSFLDHPLFRMGGQHVPLSVTLGAAFSISVKMPNLLFLDPGGSTRVVTLPAEASSKGRFYIIVNTADGNEDLTVQEDGASTTIGLVARDEIGWFFCDGTTWWGDTVAGTAQFSFSQSSGALSDIQALSISSGFGFSASAQFSAVINAIKDLRAALVAKQLADYA